MRLILAALLLAACDPMTKPTRAELESDARALFDRKIVVKDPGSNLCVVILDGEYAKRPIFQIFMVRCKSEKHLLEPVSE
jgi:hypothetical protein